MAGPDVVLDTQPLVLLVAGLTDRAIVARHKNLKSCSQAEYDRLLAVVRAARRVLVTPHVLTEASNLLRQIGEPDRGRLTVTLGKLIGEFDEIPLAARAVAVRPEFVLLGLTDAGLIEGGQSTATLWTSDHELRGRVAMAGLAAVHLQDLRAGR